MQQTDDWQQLHVLRIDFTDGANRLQAVHSPLQVNFHKHATEWTAAAFQKLQRRFAATHNLYGRMDILQHAFDIFGLPVVVVNEQDFAFV